MRRQFICWCDMNSEWATSIEDFHNACNQVGVDCWVSNGSLLGLIREKDKIAWDGDIDFGVFYEKLKPELFSKLKEIGFVTKRCLGLVDDGLELTFQRDGTNIDLFVHYHSNSKFTYSSYSEFSLFSARQITYQLPEAVLDEFQYITIEGYRFFVPRNWEKYLSILYGDWKVPKPEWDYSTDPHNLVQYGDVIKYADSKRSLLRFIYPDCPVDIMGLHD